MRTQRGFTLIELSVVTAIVVILLGLVTINLVSSQQTISLTSFEDVLLADLKQQQLNSMIGNTSGGTVADSYGIHFDSTQYILFHGATYSSSDTSNITTNLESNMQFNSPGFDVIFSKLSGATSEKIIELKDNTNSKLKRIHLNALGVITQIESL